MRSDSPSPSWYEPDASWDDADADPVPEPWPAEVLHVAHGVVTWISREIHDTDD